MDEIVHVVNRRTGPDSYTRIGTLEEYTRRIGRGSALSTNIELVPVQKKLGGNGPIFAEALKKNHFQITYLGCVGKETVDPVFEGLARNARLIGLADPGHTDAYEFTDGKIIASKTQSFKEITWNGIIRKLGLDSLVRIIDGCDLVGMENWTMLPGMSDIWTHFLSDVLPRLTRPPHDIHMFFDLADPEKRDEKDILFAVSLIGEFSKKGFQTALGLNKKEACEIAEIFGMKIKDYRAQPLRPLCNFLSGCISVGCLVIHPVDCACCFSNGSISFAKGPFCKNPVIATGAGDIFNAGFVLGWMNGFSMEESLQCGVYASGYYVRLGKSPTASKLAEFIQSNPKS